MSYSSPLPSCENCGNAFASITEAHFTPDQGVVCAACLDTGFDPVADANDAAERFEAERQEELAEMREYRKAHPRVDPCIEVQRRNAFQAAEGMQAARRIW